MEFLAICSSKWHPDDVQPNIIVPFANDKSDPGVLAATRLNLTMQGLKPRYERLNDTLDSLYSYDRLFRKLWADGEPFIIVEHDILPWPGALQQMWLCDKPWCGFEYICFGELRVQLGCVKFDPSRLGPVPLPEELTVWQLLDWKIITTLASRGETGHLHEPAVSHLNYGHQRVTDSLTLRPEPLP